MATVSSDFWEHPRGSPQHLPVRKNRVVKVRREDASIWPVLFSSPPLREEQSTVARRPTRDIIYLLCVTVWGSGGACAVTQVWRSEGNSWESVFSLHHVGSQDQTRVTRLGSSNFLYLLSQPASFCLRPLPKGLASSRYHCTGHWRAHHTSKPYPTVAPRDTEDWEGRLS